MRMAIERLMARIDSGKEEDLVRVLCCMQDQRDIDLVASLCNNYSPEELNMLREWACSCPFTCKPPGEIIPPPPKKKIPPPPPKKKIPPPPVEEQCVLPPKQSYG